MLPVSALVAATTRTTPVLADELVGPPWTSPRPGLTSNFEALGENRQFRLDEAAVSAVNTPFWLAHVNMDTLLTDWSINPSPVFYAL